MKSRIVMLRNLMLGVLVAVLTLMPAAFSAFDPVNDDTDIFLVNPNAPETVPNVLIIVDNTANWGPDAKFATLKAALNNTFGALDGTVRVGMMMYSLTGAAEGGNEDGGTLRFAVRPMTTTPGQNFSGALQNIVSTWHIQNDRSNSSKVGLAFLEAYRYYAGKKSISAWTKTKTDKVGTTDPKLTGASSPQADLDANQNCATHRAFCRALSAPVTADTLYNTPALDACQKNFIILIANDGPADQGSDNALVAAEISANGGNPGVIPVAGTSNSDQASMGDEMARFLSERASPAVTTYVVHVDPDDSNPAKLSQINYYKSVGAQGKGGYIGASSAGSEIEQALKNIFAEIKAVNTVFAASTLPVSVNVRGTNLNQVYIGVFRPDEKKKPRWYGNLKMYQLATDPTGTVFLADANGNVATETTQNTDQTGFIKRDATSFWTQAEAGDLFWSFRQDTKTWFTVNESPDGDIVEKGAVGQQLRNMYNSIAYNAAAEGFQNRKLYTCTVASALYPLACEGVATVPGGRPLSATPFKEDNAAITDALLQLGTRDVSPLTAYQSRAVASIVDRRAATLNNSSGGATVTGFLNNGTTLTVSSLVTDTPRPITTLTGMKADTVNISSIAKVNPKSGPSYWQVTTVQSLPTSFQDGVSVTLSGNVPTAYNATFTIANRTANSFRINPGGNPADATTVGLASVTAASTTARATVASGHGFGSSGTATVTIAGAVPAAFNATNATVTLLDANTFTYTIGSAQGAATTNGTVSGQSSLATVTTVGNHGFNPTNPVSIYGATPAGLSGSFTVLTTPTPSTFTYNLPSPQGNNTAASGVYAVRGGSTTVTVTAVGHGFVGGNVTISGATIAGYNGTFAISNVMPNSFDITTSQVLPSVTPISSGTVTASAATSTTVTVSLPAHGFAVNEQVLIESTGVPDPNFHNRTAVVVNNDPAGDGNSFTFVTAVALSAPVTPSAFTARSLDNPKAFVKLGAAHSPALASGNTVRISGANPAAYNGDKIITTMSAASGFDFSYPLSPAPGANTSGAVTSAIKTTTATATSIAHGFGAPNDTVNGISITGASPFDFNMAGGSIFIVDANTFTYTIGSAQGDATGTIKAGGAASPDRNNLIRWVRGQDVFADENANGSSTDVRASIHGDVLHSRPAVINYSRYIDPVTGKFSPNDVYVFYGANDGVFRAVKGGFATDAAATALGEPAPGQEAWGFIPQEFFPSLRRLRNNSPIIGSSNKRPYFADGSIGIYINDINDDGKIDPLTDTANLYISMRRGGRFIYALNVSDPNNPKFLWKIDSATAGFEELGQSWSQPTVVRSLAGLSFPVLIFGAGYDPDVEDIDPAAITAASNTGVTTASGTIPRSMGRGIYVVNALTGALVWRAVGSLTPSAGAAPPAGSHSKSVTNMDFAIPSDVTVIRNTSGGATNRAYVGDTGGNVWRIDFVKGVGDTLDTSLVTHLAQLGDVTTAANRRKIFYPPDVTRDISGAFDAVVIGTGDREHPFEGVIGASYTENRIYMLKDTGSDSGPLTGTSGPSAPVTDPNRTLKNSDLSNLTEDCIENTAGTGPCTGTNDSESTKANLKTNNGWYITLERAEKAVNAPLVVNGVVFVGTNLPPGAPTSGECAALGPARLYRMRVADATPLVDVTGDGKYTKEDRFEVVGQGFLPSPQYAITEDKRDTVISGAVTTKPPTISLGARLRKYWYKEID